MSSDLRPPGVMIGRVMARVGGADASVVRLRVERLFGGADVMPPGLPSGAILVVRSVRGRLPSEVAWSSARRWGERVRGELAVLLRGAARPLYATVSPTAASVLFVDPGELLACLTRDLAMGRAWQVWYWRQFLCDVPRAVGPALAAVWEQQAAFLPAALGFLPVREVGAALALLRSGEVSRVVRAVHACFAVSPLVLAMSVPSRSTQHAAGADGAQVGGVGALASAGVLPRGGEVPSAPWSPWLPSSVGVGLMPQAQYLFGLSLALRHAPTYARGEVFAQRAVVWFQHVLAMPMVGVSEVGSSVVSSRGVGDDAVEVSRAASREVVLPRDEMRDHAAVISRMSAVPAGAPMSPLVGDGALLADVSSSSVEREGSEPFAAPLPRDAGVLASVVAAQGAAGMGEVPVVVPLPGVTPPALDMLDGVPTALCGVFYLITLLARLDLPSGWGDEGVLAEHVSGWGVVEVLGRALLGPLLGQYVEDSVWSVLESLDGRASGTLVGARLPQFSRFCLPVAWLRFMGCDVLVVGRVGGRLLVVDGRSEVLVADFPSGDDDEQVVAGLIARYRMVRPGLCWRWGVVAAPAPLPDACNASVTLGWWLARVLGGVRVILGRMVGVRDDDGMMLAHEVLCRMGRLRSSRTHVDVCMSIEAISVPVRCAGLDCNPGWVPDLGYIVLFHFD